MSESDVELRQILLETRTLAVVGIKDSETEDAFRIPQYMQKHGYRIVPVNPKLDQVLGERVFANLGAVDTPVDCVNLFRASDHVAAHVDEVLAMSPRPSSVWMQLGIHHGGAAAALRSAGLRVVQDRCLMIEHRRLLPLDGA